MTTNLINGKQYIGDHTININQKIYYLGSGGILMDAIKKYGNSNFFKEILEWFPTRKEAFDAQEKYIKLYKTHISQGGYNISWKGGLGVKGCHSEETRIKISNSRRGKYPSEETKIKLSKALLGKNLGRHYSDEIREKMKIRSKNKNLGRHHTEETKNKISKSNIGKNTGKHISIQAKENLSKSHIGLGLGTHRSQKTKDKMKLAWKIRKNLKEEKIIM
jgi:group I intron endonuclease